MQLPCFHSTLEGGERMSEIALSLFAAIVKSFAKVFATAIAKRLLSRKKERTAPSCNRDGSEDTEN